MTIVVCVLGIASLYEATPTATLIMLVISSSAVTMVTWLTQVKFSFYFPEMLYRPKQNKIESLFLYQFGIKDTRKDFIHELMLLPNWTGHEWTAAEQYELISKPSGNVNTTTHGHTKSEQALLSTGQNDMTHLDSNAGRIVPLFDDSPDKY